MPRLRFALLALLPLLSLAGCKPKDTPATGADPLADARKGSTTKPARPAKADEPEKPDEPEPPPAPSLADARKGFTTKLARQTTARESVPTPPAKLFRTVQYDAPVGKCAAYLTPDPKDGQKRPAIVWITGGDCNTIGDVWTPAPASNDQTARQYRDAGVVMMFPSLRGGNRNPGYREDFFGEVDDVLAAAEYLAKQEHVDPNRIYLGGHSTGGTLVMLVAAVPNRFRAVFAFGPVDSITGYPAQFRSAVNMGDAREVELRSPGRWLHSIQTPTFVFEGTVEGNLSSLKAMWKASTNPKAEFYPVKRATHFSVLGPVNGVIAKKIIADTRAETHLSFTEAELNQLFAR